MPVPGEVARAAQHELLRRYHVDGDLAARAQAAEHLLPLAHSLAARYINRNEPYDDLLQVACVGLMKAIDGYDPSRSTAFSSYATPTILGEIKRHFRDRTSAVRPPRSLQELYVRVDEARTTMTSESGRGPTVTELADAVDASAEDVLAAIQAHRARRTSSLSAPTSDGMTLGDSLGRNDPALSLAEIRVLLAGAIGILSERERHILSLRFERDLTQRQIAEIMGISQMSISRLIRKALEQLRSAIGDDPPAPTVHQPGPVERAA